MSLSQRMDRKLFLSLTVTSASAFVFGCSDDGSAPAVAAGAGGIASAGNAGAAGTATAGMATAGTSASSGGTFSSAGGGGGASVGGSAGASGSAGTGTAGAAGAASAPDCAAQLKVTITANHGHVLQVALADVMAGVAKAYDTKGTSMHEHWVQLTAADFAKLQSGGTVHKLSCNGGHEHEFIVNCVGNAMPETTSGIPGFCDAGHTCADSDKNFCPELG